MKKHNFKEIKIWQEALLLVKDVYLLTANFPKEEKYGLTSQINRSAVSIPSNIAEGSGHTSNKEFVRFLEIAISSSYELETQLILVEELFNLATNETIEKLHALQNRIGGFIRQNRERIENEN